MARKKAKKDDREAWRAAFETFAANAGVTVTVKAADENPEAPEWDADHWLVTLKRGGSKKLPIPYSKSKSHHGDEPTATEVLCCLAIDARTLEKAPTFEGWCAEWGFSPREASAIRIHKSLQARVRRLKAFFEEHYDALIALGE